MAVRDRFEGGRFNREALKHPVDEPDGAGKRFLPRGGQLARISVFQMIPGEDGGSYRSAFDPN